MALAILALGGGYPLPVTVVLWGGVALGCLVGISAQLGWWPFSDGRRRRHVKKHAVPKLWDHHDAGKALVPAEPDLRRADELARDVERWEALVVATFDSYDLRREAERFGPATRPRGDSQAGGLELRQRLQRLEDIIGDLDA